MNNNHYIAIMAGGVGSRFWPASRELRPKQFLDILGVGKTLLQLTFERAAKIVPVSNIKIVSNALYKDLILEQLTEITEEQLLLEPSRNNTAPCVAYTALHLNAINSDAVFAMLPSDHVILKEEAYIMNMQKAFDFASINEAIVTLGIKPTRPDTGYGYINFESDNSEFKKVKEFKEKPALKTAQKYLDDGGFLWNAGIFVWSVKTILNAFSLSAPDILKVLCSEESKYNSTEEHDYIKKVYPKTRSISVDFAILENAKNVFTIPSDIGWSDLGTWNSLYDYLEKDQKHNVYQSDNIHCEDGNGNLIRTSNTDKLVVIKGISDYIIIDDDDVLLIYPREEEQKIKEVRKSFEKTKYV